MSFPRDALGPADYAGPAAASLGKLTSRDPAQAASLGRLTSRSSAWPASLADLEKPPAQLCYRGDPGILQASPGLMVAIVGTREASPYGIRVARSFAKAFAEAGAVVVSGMARGVDQAAHLGALEAGGKTVAVLGTGPDVPYPAGSRSLLDRVAREGLVLSESPPGTTAKPGCFPKRNRIIAALAKATIVAEAGFKSGALNTAALAIQLGRVVGAVPGPIDQVRSHGSNQLIRDGVWAIGSVADALATLGLSPQSSGRRPQMGAVEAELWHRLGEGEASPDELAGDLKITIRDVLGSVSKLEILGLVTVGMDGRIARADLGLDRTLPAPKSVRETPRRRARRTKSSPLK